MTYEEIKETVTSTFKRVMQDNDKLITIEPDESTELMGPDSQFDSVDLVSFIVALEETIEDDWSVSVILADDRALSQAVSPFKTIGSICAYIDALVNEK